MIYQLTNDEFEQTFPKLKILLETGKAIMRSNGEFVEIEMMDDTYQLKVTGSK